MGIGKIFHKSSEVIDKVDIKEKAEIVADVISEKAEDIKDLAIETKEDIVNKITELDRMLDQEITNYNDAYTLMNDKGMKLYMERCKVADTLSYIEALVNSIANHPKEFDSEFEEINICKKNFLDTSAFANKELMAARNSAGGAGAGLAAGATVACMGPTAAMWVATTFGTASTGAAISSLTGAAASNAALAWLGGGALATGGGGITAGNALLAMAGPIGWTIAGATLLTSIVIFANKKKKLDKDKNDEIESIKKNTVMIKKMGIEIDAILNNTVKLKEELDKRYLENIKFYETDYETMDENVKINLGAMVNNAKALSAMLDKTVNDEG